MNLDDHTRFSELDPGSMLERIGGLPRQCRAAWVLAQGLDLPPAYEAVRHVVVLGMGGSAIGGDLLAALVDDECPCPIFVQRGYDLPARTSMASIDLRLALFEGRPSGFHRPVHLYEPFDLVVLDHCQFGLHIGMLTAEPDRFIHASPMAGKVIISRLRHPLYKDHIAGFARCTRSL